MTYIGHFKPVPHIAYFITNSNPLLPLPSQRFQVF
jgi:hypothetical protein